MNKTQEHLQHDDVTDPRSAVRLRKAVSCLGALFNPYSHYSLKFITTLLPH